MSFSKTLLPEFDQEIANTRKLLACVPDGKFDYQPHPKSMTMARLATHVAEVPGWTNSLLDLEVLELPADFKPVIATTRAQLLEIFDKGAADARKKIEAATDADWQVTWTFQYGGQTILSNPRSVVMRGVILNHLIHHRAQLGVFLRLNDVAIPGMYGPSADEMPMTQKKAGSAA
jgi:uncharacterized damage-inducible protein DinB